MTTGARPGERPLKICAVVPYDLGEEGGVKKNALHVARALADLGDRVTLVGPMRRGPRDLPADRDGVRVRGFGGVVNLRGNGSDNHLGIFSSPRAIRRFFRDEAFDVVHLHEPLLPALPFWALWSSSGAAHVATFHGYMEREGRASRWYRRLAGGLTFGR
jgi:phosphatidylinositol alpha-mannosyltransferase